MPLHICNIRHYFERSADAIELIDPGHGSIARPKAVSLLASAYQRDKQTDTFSIPYADDIPP